MLAKGIIFDLGGTLMRFYPPKGNWEDMEKAGGEALINFLTRMGYNLPPDALDQTWMAMREAWVTIGQQPDPHTLTVRYQLERLLVERWRLTFSHEALTVAEHAYISGSQVHVRPIDDAVSTLQALRAAGFPIGLISNTMWPGRAHEYDLAFFGLREYFDFALFSSDEQAWKPFPAIFERAVARWGFQPQDVMYVGDSLYFDIYGGQQANLQTVWIEQPERWWPPTLEVDNIIPDWTITRVSDLIELLKQGDLQ